MSGSIHHDSDHSGQLKTSETGALETALRFRIFHERVPHESGAQIFRHQQDYPRIDSDHSLRIHPARVDIRRTQNQEDESESPSQVRSLDISCSEPDV